MCAQCKIKVIITSIFGTVMGVGTMPHSVWMEKKNPEKI